MTEADRAALAGVVQAHDVLVVCGTGGVGKTTVSAALGLGAALQGRRVLVMTIDPARRLADALGVSAALNEATEIDVPGLLGRELPEGGSLSAMMLDAKQTWDEVVQRFAKDDEARRRIINNRYYQRASRSLSGSQEYMATEQLLKVVTDGAYDLVVLDTPPSRNALDFLEAPGRMVAMLADGALRWLRPDEAGRFSATRAGSMLFGKGRQAMFGIFERFLGSEVIGGLSEFVSALSGLLEGMRRRAGEVTDLLASDRTAFLLVASPNRISLSEALFFAERLSEADIPFRGFVINRVRPTFADLREVPRSAAGIFEERPDDDAWTAVVDSVWQNHRRRARWAKVDRHHVAALKEQCGADVPYVEVPELEGEVHDLEALARMLEFLTPA